MKKILIADDKPEVVELVRATLEGGDYQIIDVFDGKEALFNWRVECEICHKQAKSGDLVEEIKQSWWKEIVPENKLVNIVMPAVQ